MSAYVRVSMPMPVRFAWPLLSGRDLNARLDHFVVLLACRRNRTAVRVRLGRPMD